MPTPPSRPSRVPAHVPVEGRPVVVRSPGRPDAVFWWGPADDETDIVATEDSSPFVFASAGAADAEAGRRGWWRAAGSDADGDVVEVGPVRSWLAGTIRGVPADALLTCTLLADDVARSTGRHLLPISGRRRDLVERLTEQVLPYLDAGGRASAPWAAHEVRGLAVLARAALHELGPRPGVALRGAHEDEVRAHAQALHECGRDAEAVRVLRDAAEDGLPLWHDLGTLHELTGDPTAAEAAYRSALAEDPDQVDALVDLGLLVLERGDAEEAEGILRAAVHLDSRAHLQWAGALFALGHGSEASEALDAAVAAGEDLALLDVVDLRGDDMATEDVVEHLRRAEAAGSSVARSTLVAVLVDAGRTDEALLLGRQALADGDDLVLGPLACATEAAGDTVTALDLFERAAQEEPVWQDDVDRLRGGA